MIDFQVVTVSTGKPLQNYFTYDQFFESLRRFSAPVLTIDPGIRWSGLGTKPKEIFRAIQNKTISSKYMIFADCYDIVWARSPFELMDMFKSTGIGWLCSTEKACFPEDFKHLFPECNTSYRYLNSGCIIAETEAMLAVLKHMELDKVPDDYRMANGQNFHVNDQTLIQACFLDQPVSMKLDYDCIVSQTLCNVKPEELDFTGKHIKNIETGSEPFNLHFNGPAKTAGLREPILKFLNL